MRDRTAQENSRNLFENMFRGHVTAEQWAVIIITGATLFAPRFIQDHSCPGPAKLQNDVSKMFYFMMIAPVAIGTVLLKRYWMRNKSNEFKRKVDLVSMNSLLSMQTWLFVSSMIPTYISSETSVLAPLSVATFLLSSWNILCTGYHLYNPEFKEGSRKTMGESLSGWRLNLATAFEANFRGASFAATVNLIVVNLLINLIYDTQHNNQPAWTIPVALLPTFAAYIIGCTSVFNDKFGTALFFVAGAAASFYCGLLPWITVADCLDPNDFWKTGFVTEGLKIVIPLSFLALGKSFFAGAYATEDPFEFEADGWRTPVAVIRNSLPEHPMESLKIGVTNCCSHLFRSRRRHYVSINSGGHEEGRSSEVSGEVRQHDRELYQTL